MKIVKVTTASGAVYLIDNGHWAKFKNGNLVDGWWSVWNLMQSSSTENGFLSPWIQGQNSWDEVIWSEPDRLEVGRHMYIFGRETWRITTPIVSVEIEEDEDE